MKIALRIAGIVALLLLMAKPSIYMYWEPSVARSQFLLFKNVAMLFLATLWYLDATRPPAECHTRFHCQQRAFLGTGQEFKESSGRRWYPG